MPSSAQPACLPPSCLWRWQCCITQAGGHTARMPAGASDKVHRRSAGQGRSSVLQGSHLTTRRGGWEQASERAGRRVCRGGRPEAAARSQGGADGPPKEGEGVLQKRWTCDAYRGSWLFFSGKCKETNAGKGQQMRSLHGRVGGASRSLGAKPCLLQLPQPALLGSQPGRLSCGCATSGATQACPRRGGLGQLRRSGGTAARDTTDSTQAGHHKTRGEKGGTGSGAAAAGRPALTRRCRGRAS